MADVGYLMLIKVGTDCRRTTRVPSQVCEHSEVSCMFGGVLVDHGT